jgi:hypothetical protein
LLGGVVELALLGGIVEFPDLGCPSVPSKESTREVIGIDLK